MSLSPQVLTVFGRGYADLPPNAVVNEYAAMAVPAFYSGVRFLCETLASLPKGVFRDGQGVRLAVAGHPLNKLMTTRAINGLTMAFVAWETLYHHAIVWGNGYQYVKRDASFNPMGLYNLSPELVTPFRYTPQGTDTPQQWYFVRGAGQDGRGQVLPATDVIHIPGLGFDGMSGYPLVYLLAESLEASRNAQRYGAKFLKRGTQVRGSIEVPGAMTNEQIAQIQDQIRRQHAGVESSLDMMILTAGAKMNNNTLPPEQSQLLQTLNFHVTDVCRLLRIPPHVVYQLDRATWSNIEYLGIEVVKYSLRAWIEKTEEELSDKLLSTREQAAGNTIVFGVDHLLRGDTKTLSDTLIAQVNAGIITVNQARQKLDLAPDPAPESDKLRVPVNFPVPGTAAEPGTAPPAPPLTPATSPPSPSKRKKSARTRAAASQAFEKLLPVLREAAARVEAKTDKAFAHRAAKPKAEMTVWANVFCAEQDAYAAEALSGAAAAIAALTGRSIDVPKIANRYAAAIRKRAADGTVKTLGSILEESIHEQQNPANTSPA